MPRAYQTQGVSFSPQQLAAARARAESLGLGFSQYVQVLIQNDVLLRRPLRILSAEDAASELQAELLAKHTAKLLESAPLAPPISSKKKAG